MDLENINESDAPKKSPELEEIKDIVKKDIEFFLNDYESFQTGISELSLRADINTRTITRYLDRETFPQIKALIKLYKVLTDSHSDKELLLKVPKIIKNRILPFLDYNSDLSQGKSFFLSADKEFLTNQAFRYIYIHTACYYLTKEKVLFLFGVHGEKTLSKMIDDKIVEINNTGRIVSGENRIYLSFEAQRLLSTELLSNFFHPERLSTLGENSIRYHIENVDLKTYNDLLTIDHEAAIKKNNLLISRKNKGDIPYWSISITDNFSPFPLYPDTGDGKSEVLQ